MVLPGRNCDCDKETIDFFLDDNKRNITIRKK